MELLHKSGDIIANRYRIIEILGQGGVGTTYKAFDRQNSQLVALKALSLKGMFDWKTSELFEREARVLSVLNHPGIPRYIDYFQVDTQTNRGFYIVQQLVLGKPLTTLVQEGWHASEAEVQRIATQILKILVYIHQQKLPLMHRDIKPQNIIRDEKGQVFLVDFGVVQDIYHSTFACSSKVLGTFGYMAPEQLWGQSVPTTDLYGLGATLLFLLTHDSPAQLPTNRLKIDFRSRTQISDNFVNFLEKMLEPNVENRFLSAKEALEVLQGKRKIAGQSSVSLPWKTLLGVGIASIMGVNFLNSFKYTAFKALEIEPIGIGEVIENSIIDEVKLDLNHSNNANDVDVEQKASLNISGVSSLHSAVISSNRDVVELLLKNGADVNAKDNQGYTPLQLAISRKDVEQYNNRDKEIVKLLIAKAADINIPLRSLSEGKNNLIALLSIWKIRFKFIHNPNQN